MLTQHDTSKQTSKRMCNSFQCIAFNACQSLCAELVGFSSAERHLKTCSTTWIQCQQNKAWEQLCLLQWNSDGFGWLWRKMEDGLYPSNSAGQTVHHLETSAGHLPMISTHYFRGPGSYTNPRWRGRRPIVKRKEPLRNHFAVSQTKVC